MMNEQEVIDYLKENKNKGVIFAFMPEDVQKWCKRHSNEPVFMHFWNKKWEELDRIACASDSVYILIEDYEPKSQFEPHWEEFEIDENGRFHSDGDLPCLWYRWFDFLNINADRYNNFGGWFYNNRAPIWTMNPIVIRNGSDYAWAEPNDKSKPATPTKIRFWRYAE